MNVREAADEDHHPGTPGQADMNSIVLRLFLHGHYMRLHIVVMLCFGCCIFDIGHVGFSIHSVHSAR